MSTDQRNGKLYPPTVIVVHHRERRRKCSVEPLRGNPDFVFLDYPEETYPNLDGYVRLALDGPLLSEEDRAKGLLILDASWRLAEKMNESFSHVPARSLRVWATAYPRVSKVAQDPAVGLATIEAIYAANDALGRSNEGLLDQYYWAEKFLQANGRPSVGKDAEVR